MFEEGYGRLEGSGRKNECSTGGGSKEKRVFQAKALRLERKALALGDEVRSALKKGKTLSSAELKGVQKLMKMTAKTTMSASSRDEPEETPAPPPEVTPPPPPPPPPQPPGQAGGGAEPPQLPPGTEAPEAGHEKQKEKEGGPPKKPQRGGRAAQASDPSDRSSSSSSSSSDSNDTGDGTIETLVRHRRKERLRKKGKGAFMIEDLADVQRDKKEKKLQIPKPDAYDGSVELNPTYQRWYETINDYLYHSRGSWEGDSDLIRVVGAFMKGKARNWYDNRARQLRSNRKTDTWSAFVSAMNERFTTSNEGDLAYVEMHRVKYQGSVMTYVDKLIGLNEKANMSGRACCTVLVYGLLHELRKDLAKLRGGKRK